MNNGQLQNSQALTALAQQAGSNSNQLFQTAFPGFAQAENFQQSLASGDPTQIARALAPAANQINTSAQSGRQSILANAPSGGEKNLAIEQSFAGQGAQLGQLGTQSYLNSFNSLGQLAGQGVGQSISAANTGVAGYGSSNQGLSNLGQEQIQQKGATLSAWGSLIGAGGNILGSLLNPGGLLNGGKGGGGGGAGGAAAGASSGATSGLGDLFSM